MITKRDQDIFNFLDDFHVASSSHLRRLFFPKTSYQYSSKRLQYLTEQGHIKRIPNTMSNGYAYYTDKRPAQVHHDLIRTEVFVNLKKTYALQEWCNEQPIGNIRPDAITFITDHGITFPFFIEIHLSNQFDFDKYKELIKNTDLKTVFGLMPKVIICTDRQVMVPQMGIRFKVVGFGMKELDTLLK